MNYTGRDLDDNLEKIAAAEELVREACHELREICRSQTSLSSRSIPDSVWTKVSQALAYHYEVDAFLARVTS